MREAWGRVRWRWWALNLSLADWAWGAARWLYYRAVQGMSDATDWKEEAPDARD